MFMHILSNRLRIWCDDHNIIDESQAGFRRKYSTVDNIFNLQAVIQKYLSKSKGRVYVYYIDFFKAFDSCTHTNLWNSLIRKGIRADSKFLCIFKSMYGQLKYCVKVSDGLTRYFECNIGTKQGCVSSPIIFSLFINDMLAYLRDKCRPGISVTYDIDEVFALMFADDVASVAETVNNLQQHIRHIENFCDATGMSLNVDKSKVMVFRNGGPLRTYEK